MLLHLSASLFFFRPSFHLFPAEEVSNQLQDSDASLVVYDDATEKVVEAALTLLKKPLRRVTNTDASPPAGVPSLRSLLQDSSLPLADPIEVRCMERRRASNYRTVFLQLFGSTLITCTLVGSCGIDLLEFTRMFL